MEHLTSHDAQAAATVGLFGLRLETALFAGGSLAIKHGSVKASAFDIDRGYTWAEITPVVGWRAALAFTWRGWGGEAFATVPFFEHYAAPMWFGVAFVWDPREGAG
jgi:hypothetical protein